MKSARELADQLSNCDREAINLMVGMVELLFQKHDDSGNRYSFEEDVAAASRVAGLSVEASRWTMAAALESWDEVNGPVEECK